MGVVAEVVEETCTIASKFEFFFIWAYSAFVQFFFAVPSPEKEERLLRLLSSECCHVGRAGTGNACFAKWSHAALVAKHRQYYIHSQLADSSGCATTKHGMRSLGKNDLRNIHVLEALCFFFSQDALQWALVMNCDDDCLTGANAICTNGKLTDVLLLTAGTIF